MLHNRQDFYKKTFRTASSNIIFWNIHYATENEHISYEKYT